MASVNDSLSFSSSGYNQLRGREGLDMVITTIWDLVLEIVDGE